MIHGQHRAVEAFAAAWSSRALHHAWLLTGPRGVGKARFADMAARRVLADAAGPTFDLPGIDTPADHPMVRLIDAASHPDFRRLERLERTPPATGLARNISVEQVRGLSELFGLTPFLSPWRVVVIDSVDDLEPSAANALLKMLEEPPANCLFLLVSHNPGRLLPTIRSRCRKLRLAALDDDAMTSILAEQIPEANPAERARIATLAGGSAGRALAYAEFDLASLEADALAIMRDGDRDNGRRAKLAQSLATRAAAPRYAAFLDLVPVLIAREARSLGGGARVRALDAYARARTTSQVAPRLTLDPGATSFHMGTILAAVAGDG